MTAALTEPILTLPLISKIGEIMSPRLPVHTRVTLRPVVRQSSRPAVPGQAVFVGEDNGVHAVAQPEFHQDAAHVCFHC
ncbi:hypothetical protein ACVWZ8_001486 [Arthrobacter sp. UYCu723]